MDDEKLSKWAPVLEIGLNHEQQQELMLTDLNHNLSINPLRPAYHSEPYIHSNGNEATPLRWISFDESVYPVGHDGKGFAFDNESPRHRVFVEPFELASRLVTNGEFLAFMNDSGYQRHDLWLSEGFGWRQNQEWNAPHLLGTEGWRLVGPEALWFTKS